MALNGEGDGDGDGKGKGKGDCEGYGDCEGDCGGPRASVAVDTSAYRQKTVTRKGLRVGLAPEMDGGGAIFVRYGVRYGE